MKKINRAPYGPSMSEVVLGATLSVVLGAVLGVVYLVIKPVATVKEIPKDAPPDAVYYIAGPRGGGAGQLAAKRKIFATGASMTVSQDELNTLAAAERPSAPAKPKPAAGAKAPATPAAQGDLTTIGTPNFRIHDGEMQVVVPVKVSIALLGLERDILVQTQGPFVKKDSGIAYDPEKLWVGSCPAGRLPGATGFIIRKVLLAKPLPEDIATGWAKLADVAIVGTALKLTPRVE